MSGASSCGAPPCAIDAQDDQVRAEPIYRAGSTTGRGFIYYAQSIELTSPTTRTLVQWTKITPSTSAAFADGGRIDDSSGALWYEYPHIAVNSLGDFLVGYSRFGSGQHPSAASAYHD